MVYHEQGGAFGLFWICNGYVLRDDYRNTEQDTAKECFLLLPVSAMNTGIVMVRRV